MSTNFVSVRLMKEKRIEEVNKKIPRVAEIDREIFNAVWRILKEYLKSR